MNATNKLLDKWWEIRSPASNKAAGLILGVTGNPISNYRAGLSQAEAHVIERMARDIGDDPLKWLALVESERARRPADKKAWAAAARRLGAAAALACVLLTALPAHSAPYGQAEQNQPIYIMRNVRRWLRSAFNALRLWNSPHGCTHTSAVLA